MIYLVLGMHKSGTTLVSRMLHESGINMVEFDGNTEYNANKYERETTNRLNKEILKCGNQYSLEVRKVIQPEIIPEVYYIQGNKIVKDLNNKYHDWGFKDPRTCLIYEYWNQIVNQGKIIFIFRNPTEVWKHYYSVALMNRFYHYRFSFQAGILALRCWYIYNQNVLNYLEQDIKKKLVISYSELMSNDIELLRLERFVNRSLIDVRDMSLYRNKYKYSLQYEIAKRICKHIYNEDIDWLQKKLVEVRNKQMQKI